MSDRESQSVANIASWSIKVGGTVLAAAMMNVLIGAEVESTLEVPDMAVLRFQDPNLELVDGTVLVPGKELEISPIEGTAPARPALFKGEIVGIEPSFDDTHVAVLTVRAYDKRHRMNREQKTRSFQDVKDSDIVSQLVGSAGLSAAVEATTQVRKVVFQQNQTDLEFLSLLARRNGYETWMDGTTLHFKKAPTTSVATLTWGVTLKSFHPRLSLAGQVNEVTVRGWDNKQGKALVGKATSSVSAPAIGFGKSGGQGAQSAFSAAKHLDVRHVVHSQDEANKIAQSLLDEINSDFLEADGVAIGNAAIRAGKTVTIDGVGTKFAGTYHVSSANHVYSLDNGYEVQFRISGARPKTVSDLVASSSGPSVVAASSPADYPAAAVGIVTNNDDPDNLGRVKVKFPWFDDTTESFWSRVSMPGAGQNRGFFCLPEVNDEVLVVFLHGDMNWPVVVGGLYNSVNTPPLKSSDAVESGKVVNRMMKTTAGHIIEMKEKSGAQSIMIKDGQGKAEMTMDATNNKMSTTVNGDISIESKTAKVTITATGDISIESKGNVNIKANANVSIEGNAQVTLKGSGPVTVQSAANLTLKGSMVQIN
jgi:uncharacterized protein involved in type VI secretion and phage assembly